MKRKNMALSINDQLQYITVRIEVELVDGNISTGSVFNIYLLIGR